MTYTMSTIVKHSGIIEQISKTVVKVRIIQTAACSSCKLASQCNPSEKKSKTIDIFNADTNNLNVGDEVVVAATQANGLSASLIGYGIPLVLLVVVLVTVNILTGNELYAALLGILSLFPYYVIIYFLRDKLRRKFVFCIVKS